MIVAFINGAVVCVPLVAAVWVALRLSRGWLNAVTRYSIWWIVMAAVILAPLAYLPHSRPAPSVTQPERPVAIPRATFLTPGVIPVRRVYAPADRIRPFRLDAVPTAVVGLWIGFTGIMLLRLVICLVMLQRIRARGTPVGTDLSALASRCLARCRVRRDVAVLRSGEIASPMVAGPLKPFLLLPNQLADALGAGEMELVCLHEAAHLARYDDAALLLQRVLQALLVWNPLVHWISRQIDLEREIACDDLVVGLTREPKPYASCLTRVAEMAGSFRVSPLAAASTDGRSHLTTRVELLLDKTRHSGTRLLKSRLAVVLAALSAIAALLAQSPRTVTVGPEVVRRAPVLTAQSQPQPPKTPAPAPAVKAVAASTAIPDQPNMRVFVTVTDPLNRFVSGLDSDNFTILENGVRQRITKFNGEDEPASIWIVWDVRQGGDPKRLADLKSELAGLLTRYAPQHPKVRDVQAQIASLERDRGLLERDILKLQAQIASLEESASGATSGQEIGNRISARNMRDRFVLVPLNAESLRDTGRDIAASPNARKAVVVVLSEDHQSELLLPGSDFANAVGDARVPVFPLAFTDGDAVAAQVSRIAIELHNQYILEYASKQKSRNAVEVKIDASRGLQALTPHSHAVVISSTR